MSNVMWRVFRELEWSKIDSEGNVLGCYSGSTIFVKKEGKSGAEMVRDKIYIMDWNDALHLLDFAGNLIK